MASDSPILPWTNSAEEERRYRKMLLICCLLFILLGIIVPLISLPEPKEEKILKLPPRLVQLISERQKKPPPSLSKNTNKAGKKTPKKTNKPKAAKPKPKFKKTVDRSKKSAPEKKRSPKPSQEVTLAAARKKAASSGLLALSDSLSDLRDTSLVAKLGQRQVTAGGASKAKKSGGSSGGVLAAVAAGVGATSGGVNSDGLQRTAGGTALTSRGTSTVASASAASAGNEGGGRSSGRGSGKGQRSFESVKRTINQNKGAIYNIYNRELRKDPTLEGVIVVELTIAPSGKVQNLRLVSSELNTPGLENKLLTRLRLINFGAKNVETYVTTLPIEFFPA